MTGTPAHFKRHALARACPVCRLMDAPWERTLQDLKVAVSTSPCEPASGSNQLLTHEGVRCPENVSSADNRLPPDGTMASRQRMQSALLVGARLVGPTQGPTHGGSEWISRDVCARRTRADLHGYISQDGGGRSMINPQVLGSNPRGRTVPQVRRPEIGPYRAGVSESTIAVHLLVHLRVLTFRRAVPLFSLPRRPTSEDRRRCGAVQRWRVRATRQ
jgi:hypothetical protein